MTLNERINNPDTMRMIVDHVANGGSLIDLCELWQLRYSDINNWIYNNPERTKLYETAIKARSEWFVQRVLKEIRNISTVDIREAYDDDGNLKDMKDIPSHVAAAIARVETFEEYQGSGKDREYIGRTKKVFFVDKMKAAELLAKHIFFFVEHRIITGDVNVHNKVDQFDLDERIKKITHATITTMEAERIAADQPN